MTTAADPLLSRAVLIGTGRYRTLGEIRAVHHNLAALAEVLRADRFWGLPQRCCVVVEDPVTPPDMLDPVVAAAQDATDTLLMYYAGHGLVDPRRCELHLALTGSDPQRIYTAVPYTNVRDVLLESRAARRIVILDCCYSGRALGQMNASSAVVGEAVADEASAEGTYVLAASAENRVALAPPGEQYTAFTGELLAIIHNGIAGCGPFLDLDSVYRHLLAAMRRKGFPIPQKRDRNTAGQLTLIRNQAYRQPEPVREDAETALAAAAAVADRLPAATAPDTPAPVAEPGEPDIASEDTEAGVPVPSDTEIAAQTILPDNIMATGDALDRSVPPVAENSVTAAEAQPDNRTEPDEVAAEFPGQDAAMQAPFKELSLAPGDTREHAAQVGETNVGSAGAPVSSEGSTAEAHESAVTDSQDAGGLEPPPAASGQADNISPSGLGSRPGEHDETVASPDAEEVLSRPGWYSRFGRRPRIIALLALVVAAVAGAAVYGATSLSAPNVQPGFTLTDPGVPTRSQEVWSLAFSPTSTNQLAAGTDNGNSYLWNVATRTITAPLPVPDAASNRVNSVAFSADGSTLATGDSNGSIYLWGIPGGNLEQSPLTDPNSKGVISIAISPKGILVAGDGNGNVYFWDLATKKKLPLSIAASYGIDAIALSHDGTLLAVAGGDGEVHLYDVATQKPAYAPLNYSAAVEKEQFGMRLQFSPVQTLLATSVISDNVYLWNERTRVTETLSVSSGAEAVAFSPSGKILAVSTIAGEVELWSIATRTVISRLGIPATTNFVTSLAFSRDGELAGGTVNGEIYIWQASRLPA